jgi:hypothetical protein
VAGQPFADDPGWLAGPFGAVLTVLGVLCGLVWLLLPVVLLVVGNVELLNSMSGGWWWQAAWSAVVVVGGVIDPMILWAGDDSYTGDGFGWRWLAVTLSYLAVGAALAVILRAAPRSPGLRCPAADVRPR